MLCHIQFAEDVFMDINIDDATLHFGYVPNVRTKVSRPQGTELSECPCLSRRNV